MECIMQKSRSNESLVVILVQSQYHSEIMDVADRDVTLY